ncbi:MAG: DUF1700 domain-containing protein [Terracidiphilus sp.]|jgi:hypothetical protein
MTLSAESQKTVDAYLAALRKQLRELMDEDVNDIVAEIRAHILDKTSGEAAGDSVSSTLAALGTPEELAARYRTEELLERARMSRSPKFLLRSVLRWAALSIVGLLVFTISVVGYLIGGWLSILGVLKLINPHNTGIYGQFSDTSSSLSFQSGGPPAPGVHELLGWWLLPIGLILGPVLFFYTFRFDLWSLRKFWRPRAWR